MTKMSLIDKLGVLIEVTKSSKLFIIAIIFLLFLAYIFKTTNQKNSRTSKKIYLVIYGSIIAFLLIMYRSSLGSIFDYMMDNFFIVFYFPNIAIYFAAIIITNIILWISIFNFKISKLIKNINITFYCIVTYLMILVLNIITTNKIDVFNQTSLYGNKQVQALIELSSVLFIIWILFLGIYQGIRTYQKKQQLEELEELEELEKYIEERPTLPNNVERILAPRYVMAPPPKRIQLEPQREIERPVPQQTEKPISKQENPFDQLLTLEDYKLLLNILKEQKQKVKLDQVRNIQLEEEQPKLQDLQELYRSVR